MADAPPTMTEKLTSLRGGAVAVAVGTLVLLIERATSTLLLDQVGLPFRSALAWWGANVGIALLVWVIGGVGLAVTKLIVRDEARTRLRRVLQAFLTGLFVAALAAPLGENLGAGGWISQQSWAWVMRFVPAILVAGFTTVLGIVAGFIGERFPRVVGGLLGLAGAGLVVVDHLVLLGTYPDLHLLLHLCASVSLVAAVVIVPWAPRGNRARVLATMALVVACAGPVLWLTVPLGYRPQLSMSSQMANLLMERTMPRIDLEFAEREFAQVDPNAGRYLPEPSGTHLARKDWNVLWITVDTLRWDALWPGRSKKGAVFSKPGDTPFLDKWLQESVVFERNYAQASATHRSMPPMFKSLEANEPTLDIGTPLGRAAARTGRTSIAVVNNFFLEPRYKRSQSLLWGFDVVQIYHKTQQEELQTLLDQAIAENEGRGFFTWLHFYNMHDPGYDESGLQSKGPLTVRYRRSLKWLDRQMAKVVQTLRARGVADDTIIVFCADHGESLGANRIANHGPTIYEEEIRTPLAFYIPGVKPRRIAQTSGNIDIVPTLWDAMGVDPEPTFRGRSMLGAIVGDEAMPTRPYYMENANGDTRGIALGAQKLMHKTKSGTTMRFDVEKDPKEDENLFTDGPDDKPLLAALYQKNPDSVLVTPIMGAIAASQIEAIDPAAPGAALRYLLNVGSRSESDEATAAMGQLFGKTPHDQVKLEILAAMHAHEPDDASALAKAELARISPDREQHFVEGLSQVGVAAIDTSVVKRRFDPPPGDDVATAWIHWLQRWESPKVGEVLSAYTKYLRTRTGTDPELLRAIAELIRSADLSKGEKANLLDFNRWLIVQNHPRVIAEAVTTAGDLHDKAAGAAVRALTTAGSIRVRQAALYALAKIDGADSVEAIVAAGEDPRLVLDAVRALELTRSKRAIPFVEGISKNHYNWIIRDNAKSALKKLTK